MHLSSFSPGERHPHLHLVRRVPHPLLGRLSRQGHQPVQGGQGQRPQLRRRLPEPDERAGEGQGVVQLQGGPAQPASGLGEGCEYGD